MRFCQVIFKSLVLYALHNRSLKLTFQQGRAGLPPGAAMEMRMLISHDKDGLAALKSRSFRETGISPFLRAALRKIWTAFVSLFRR